jgi:hypothetical protein
VHQQDVLNGRRYGEGLFRVRPFDHCPRLFSIAPSTAAWAQRRSISVPNSKNSITVS